MMEIVFTYLPMRLKDVTELYLTYSIKNLNSQNIIPTIYSDNDYFIHTDLKYKWIEFDVDTKYKIDTLWSYPKLKVLSIVDRPFIHLDNDLVVEDYSKLDKLIIPTYFNLCYKHPIKLDNISDFNFIFNEYYKNNLDFSELNNTSIIATERYDLINKSYCEVLDVIEENYDFFTKRYNSIPPITLNQQYPNLYFDNVNYLFTKNPSYDDLDTNGICHMAEKMVTSRFTHIKKML